ncbi:MAG: SDR family oxidoreductase [Actinobacteria bacterium]|nr:SDR family oxidoreductase [Actinomycetota bacterium]
MIQLDGKVAIITGAGDARGQGAASARLMSSLGASVVLADIDGEESQARAVELRDEGRAALAVPTDVRDEGQVEALVEAALAEFGRLDILHSQAADLRILADPGDPQITEVSVDLWRTEFETIVLGTLLSCKHAIPAMLRTGGGSIICTSSISGMMGELNLTVYGAAKAAVNQLVRSVSAQFGKQGIRCNAIAPGLILSSPGLDMGQELIDQYARHCDTPGVGRPEDVAPTVAFLASDAASYISGSVVTLDGGFISHSPMAVEQRSEGRILGGQGA